jgi:protein O-GlcNAc transferase
MPSVTAPQGKPLDVARTFDQALTLHHQGRIAEAEALYSVVLAARPDHFDALQMLGVIKLGRGDLPAALRLTGAALQQRPTSPQVLLNHGNVLDAMQRHHAALANFDEAIKRKKGFAEAHCNRGATLLALERHEEALESLKRDRAQAGLCGRVLQPGQCAAHAQPLSRSAEELRPGDCVAPEIRQGLLQPRRGA